PRRNTQSPGTTRCPGKRRFGPIENHPHAAARKSIVKFHAHAPPPTPAATPQFSLPHILSAYAIVPPIAESLLRLSLGARRSPLCDFRVDSFCTLPGGLHSPLFFTPNA